MSIQQYLTEQNDNGSTSRWKIIRQTYSGGTVSPTIQAPGKKRIQSNKDGKRSTDHKAIESNYDASNEEKTAS